MHSLRTYLRSGCLLIVVFASACTSGTSERDGSSTYYQIRDTDTDGGTGRFYMDREIADVMTSVHGAIWLERPARDTAELPSRLIRILDLNPSAVVADIGAGTGYITFMLSKVVPHGRVLAVEVQHALLDTIQVRMARERIRNVQTILGTVDNPALPQSGVDLALIVASYHEFSHPREMLDNIFEALKPGGRIVIVEYRAEDETIPIKTVHRMSEQQIRRELEVSGYVWRETRDVLPQQHIVVFEKPLTGRLGG